MVTATPGSISRNSSRISLNSFPKEPQQQSQKQQFIKIGLEDKIASYEDAAGTQDSSSPNYEDSDTFLRYSDDDVRMAALLLKEDTEHEGPNSKRRCPRRSQGAAVERKTRISYEVHYSLLIEDDLLDMFDNEDHVVGHSNRRVSCDHETLEELDGDKMSEMSPKEILDILLQL